MNLYERAGVHELRLERHFDDVAAKERINRPPGPAEERLTARFSDREFSPLLLKKEARGLFDSWRAWLVDVARDNTAHHHDPLLLRLLEKVAVMLTLRGDQHLELAESYGVWTVEALGLLNACSTNAP